MAHVNLTAKEIQFKVVYFGPVFGGKASNFFYLHRVLAGHVRAYVPDMIIENQRVLFLEFLSPSEIKLGDFTIRFHLYTVPGVVLHETALEKALEDTDGVVFVVDSQEGKLDEILPVFSSSGAY
jgi:signal recognition particle receptor subunit beta